MMILLTGGSACGKSSYGERLCVNQPGPRYYIAAMKPYGIDGAEKVARHRKLRQGKGFETIERYTDLASLELSQKGGCVLLECICNLTANEMFDQQGNIIDPCEKILDGVRALRQQCDYLVVITNEVGTEDGSCYDAGTQEYMRSLGKINIALAKEADTVLELVCGIPLVLKGELEEGI